MAERAAIVTGASSGIGPAMRHLLRSSPVCTVPEIRCELPGGSLIPGRE